MSDIVKNTVKNIIYPFSIKGSDFKELSLKALEIKNWIDENGQELADFIMRHRNLWNATNYENIHLKDMPSAISKVDFVFREPINIVNIYIDDLNKKRNEAINFKKYIENNKIEIKNNMTQARFIKQNQLFKEEELKKQELIEKANNLNENMGLDMDQIQDEQVRVMEEIEQIDKSLEPKQLKKVGINIIKEKILIKDIEILGINDDFLEKANNYELKELIKNNYLIVNEKLVQNTIKAQYDINKDINLIGVKGINFKINKGVK